MNNTELKRLKARLNRAPDIIGKNKYFNTAVLIPLVFLDDEINILFEKRSETIRQGGEVSFPGGHYDPELDKDCEQTALRETCEELGIDRSKVEILGKFGSLVAPMGLTVDVFAGVLRVESAAELKYDISEVQSIFTLPLSFFLNTEPEIFYSRLEIHTIDTDENGSEVVLLPVKQLGLPEFYNKPWRNGKYRVLVYKTAPDIIWGITAEIIYEFAKLIKDQND